MEEIILLRQPTRPKPLQDAVKRIVDICGAGFLLAALSPIMAAIALFIRLDSPGTILFRQQRPGRDMSPFTMLKFRTMREGSDKIPAEVLREAGFGPLQKRNVDPRITRSGRILRRYSLDELPQLMNVVRGDMSLVGPRPLLGWEIEGLKEQMELRASVRPGLTGLWQVSGRSNLSFEEMLRLDLEYAEKRSFLMDARILLKTIPAVLTGDGAY
ncbi:MAG: sugar transferase [Dehalococcoidia bacterium]|nr:sugar transferase [Dehalococcoidia bacterium]